MHGLKRHWNGVYTRLGATQVSWYQPVPQTSLELIAALEIAVDKPIIDVGGGASTLADELIARGYGDVTVLDTSSAALELARQRTGDNSVARRLAADVLEWQPDRTYGLWHDRGAFHFIVDPAQRARYLQTMRAAAGGGGALIIATFAADGPERCSGLPVTRYGGDDLVALLGDDFDVTQVRREKHTTPSGVVQPFTWVAARARG